MSRIWQFPITIEMLNARNAGTLCDYLDIVFTEIGDDYLIARMPVAAKHLQPFGIMNGGVSCVLAETVGSVGANCCIDFEKQFCVGLDINTNHISAVRSGAVTALGKPFHLGRQTQVWSIEVRDENERLVSVSRLTVMVLQR